MIATDIHPALLASDSDRDHRAAPRLTRSNPVGGPGEEGANTSSPIPGRFMGLDQSARLVAYAIGSRNMERPVCGTEGFPTRRGPSGEEDAAAILHQVRAFLLNRFRDPRLTHVFYEQVFIHPKFPDVGLQLGQVVGIVLLTCKDHGRRPVQVSPGAWRKRFLGIQDSRDLKGTGFANLKDAAVAQCDSIGWNVASHHEAEACGILHFGLASEYPDYAIGMTPLFRGREG